MKETGIMMSGNHPQLILDGTKTMTRRTWGLEKVNEHPELWQFTTMQNNLCHFTTHQFVASIYIKCPYGGVGDWLWVKETWAIAAWMKGRNIDILYKNGGIQVGLPWDDWAEKQWDTETWDRWRSPRFMPKKYARIWRQITEVRAGRLQDITEEDAIAEGCLKQVFPYDVVPRWQFKDLWDSLNAKRGHPWDRNDWVWPISFKG